MSPRSILTVVFLFLAAATPATATVILVDDFSSDTLNSNWKQSTIISTGTPGTYTFDTTTTSDALTVTLTGYSSGYRQEAFLRSDYSLPVGGTLMTDFVSMIANGTYTNVAGLFVATSDTMDTNGPTAQYYSVNIGIRRKYSSQYILYMGYYGGSATSATLTKAPDGLYIARTAANTYVAGYYVGDTFTSVGTYTADSDIPGQAQNPGAAIGYFADTRFTGATECFDNFRLDVVPEPSTLVLLGMGAVGLLAYAWRKRR